MSRKFIYTVLIAFLLTSAPLNAQEVLRLQPDFTFKMVGVPSGNGPIDLVQIDPDAAPLEPVYADPDSALSQDSPNIPDIPVPAALAWFWTTVPSAIDQAGPARFQLAMAQINNPPAGERVPVPRLGTLQSIAQAHQSTILAETVGTPISPALVLAVIAVESAGRSDAISSAGAQGLMQLMPDTAKRFDVTDRSDPVQNIKGGVTYLAWLLDHFDGDALLALAGYNAGEGNVRRHNGVPPFAETRDYVPKVLAAWKTAKGLCRTPPQLITDPCIFNIGDS